VPGPSDSWYREKDSAWLYRAVAAAEPDAAGQTLFLKLATVAEEQADSWRRTHARIVADFTPALRAPATHDIPTAADQVGGRVGKLLGASLA
jgi:hypothetical protein